MSFRTSKLLLVSRASGSVTLVNIVRSDALDHSARHVAMKKPSHASFVFTDHEAERTVGCVNS